MDVTLDTGQQLVRDSIRALLDAEYDGGRIRQLERTREIDRNLWDRLVELGWTALPIPVGQGGAGGDLVSLGVVVEELARHAAIVPYAEVMTATVTLARHGRPEIAAPEVSRIISGVSLRVPAVLDRADRYDAATEDVWADGRIRGERLFVDYGQHATGYLTRAHRDVRERLLLVDVVEGQTRHRNLSTIGRLPSAQVEFLAAPAVEAAGSEGAAFLLLLGRALAAIQCLGYAQKALDMTTEYVKDRVQFGRPIGSFQAVQHHCANMATMTESLRFLAYEALWSLDQDRATAAQVALAKAWAAKTAVEVTALAHQLHGGIGVTEEYDLHFYSLRAKDRALAWGGYGECLAVVAAGLGADPNWF